MQYKEIKREIKLLESKLHLLYNELQTKKIKDMKFMKNNKKTLIDILDVAQYLIRNQNKNDYTKMKLQKLVFFTYCQHLIEFKKPFFKNDWEAWEYGPVSPRLYLKTLEYTKRILPDLKIVENFNSFIFNERQIQIMNNILKKYGILTAGRLVSLTHEVDSPWTRSFLFKDWSLNPITDKRILNFYEGKANILSANKKN